MCDSCRAEELAVLAALPETERHIIMRHIAMVHAELREELVDAEHRADEVDGELQANKKLWDKRWKQLQVAINATERNFKQTYSELRNAIDALPENPEDLDA